MNNLHHQAKTLHDKKQKKLEANCIYCMYTGFVILMKDYTC